MPTLKQITCGIELGPGNVHLKEYGHKVTDGAVESYIVAPETDIPFHVRITSDGYIAPGLAAYVFIDGEYQCNRNRLRLRFPENGASSTEYEIDFKLRQKEEKTGAGTFIARDWCFAPLGTSTADKVLNMENFQDNVGTIEVVILRCKDGGEEKLATDPAQTTVSRNPAYTTRLPSVRAPSVRLSSVRAPSARAVSAVKSPAGSIYGGMMDIFDGAGDHPGYYRQYRPRNIIGQEHLPGHKWDPSSGLYRYFNDQDPFVHGRDQGDSRYGSSFPADRYSPQTYTVGGGFSYQGSVQPQEERPEGPKIFVPQSSPGYDFSARRRKGPAKDMDRTPQSTYDFTRSTRSRQQDTERPQRRQGSIRPQVAFEKPEKREQREDLGTGFAFVEHCSHRLLEMIERFGFEHEKYNSLKDDADRYYNRKVIYNEMLKAAHRKYIEVTGIMDALGELYDVVKQAMDGLNRETWRRASDLLYEKNLYPPPVFQVESPTGRDEHGKTLPFPFLTKDDKTTDSAFVRGGGFEQVGENTTGGKRHRPGAERSDRGKQTNSQASPSPRKDDKKKDADSTWPNADAGITKSDEGWGVSMSVASSDKQSKATNEKWSGSEAKQASTGWGDAKNEKSAASDGDTKDDDKKAKCKDDTWGKAEEPNKAWEVDVKKVSQHSSRRGSGSKSHRAPVNDGACSDSSSFGDQQPKPVIKPYWSEWTKKQAVATPKVQPREVYEYPAPPLPALPSGKAAKGITQAVHAGRGVNYAHKLHRPEYLDTMAKPYAIFTFKYRSKTALEAILKHKVDDSNISEAKAEMKKHILSSKSKDELVEELMKKTSIAAQSRTPSRVASHKDEKQPTPSKFRESKTRSVLKPSDSISQVASKVKSASGWGGGDNDWGGSNKEGSADKWGSSNNHDGKSNARSKASHHSVKADDPGNDVPGSWAAAGWGSVPKSTKKSAATANHFGSSSGLKQTSPKVKW